MPISTLPKFAARGYTARTRLTAFRATIIGRVYSTTAELYWLLKIHSTKPGTTSEPPPRTCPKFGTGFHFPAAAPVCGRKLHAKVTHESCTQKLHAFLDESYIGKLHTKVTDESCIIIQRRTDPGGSAKVTCNVIRKVV